MTIAAVSASEPSSARTPKSSPNASGTPPSASFVYQDVYGVSPAAFSVLFAVNAVGMLGANELNRRLLVRFSPAQLLAAAPAVGTASAFFGTLRLGLGALATPLVGLAGGKDGVSMGLVIAGAGMLALVTFTVVAWRDRGRSTTCELQPGTCADMTVC